MTTVVDYFIWLAEAGMKPSTIDRRRASIAQYHRAAGLDPPLTADWAVRQVLSGIRREHGQPPVQKAPLSPDELRRMIAGLDITTNGDREKPLEPPTIARIEAGIRRYLATRGSSICSVTPSSGTRSCVRCPRRPLARTWPRTGRSSAVCGEPATPT
jgi:hypothetical protein